MEEDEISSSSEEEKEEEPEEEEEEEEEKEEEEDVASAIPLQDLQGDFENPTSGSKMRGIGGRWWEGFRHTR
jgi:hypothetical protein